MDSCMPIVMRHRHTTRQPFYAANTWVVPRACAKPALIVYKVAIICECMFVCVQLNPHRKM